MKERVIQIGPVIRAVVALVGLTAAVFVAWACANIEMLYAAVGMLSLFIVLAPFLQLKEYDLFCPWSFVILPVGLLSAPQAVAMSFSFPSQEAIERMMLLGQEPEYFLYPAAIFLIAMLALTIGYFGFKSKRPRRVVLARQLNAQRLIIVLGIVGLISVTSTYSFIRATGGGESNRLTDKRTNLKTIDVEGGDTRQYGHLRQVAKLSSVVFLVFFGFALTRKERLGLPIILLLCIAFLFAIALPFYASSRAQVCWVIINTIGVNYYLGRGNLLYQMTVFFALGLTVFLLMSALRNRDQSAAMQTASIEKSIESLILNRNGPGLSKTAHIINSIPDKLEYQYGSTFTEWFLAPVPRAIYPTKPMIGRGIEVGNAIYNTRLSGIPPGYIAELYWNFHIAGVVFGMLFFGFILEKLHAFFRDLQTDPAIVVPVYLFSVIPVAFGVLGNCLGYGTMMRMVDFVSIAVVVWMCTQACAYSQNYVHPPQPATPHSTGLRQGFN